MLEADLITYLCSNRYRVMQRLLMMDCWILGFSIPNCTCLKNKVQRLGKFHGGEGLLAVCVSRQVVVGNAYNTVTDMFLAKVQQYALSLHTERFKVCIGHRF